MWANNLILAVRGCLGKLMELLEVECWRESILYTGECLWLLLKYNF